MRLFGPFLPHDGALRDQDIYLQGLLERDVPAVRRTRTVRALVVVATDLPDGRRELLEDAVPFLRDTAGDSAASTISACAGNAMRTRSTAKGGEGSGGIFHGDAFF